MARFTTAGTPPRTSYRGLPALLGIVTLAAFGTGRLLYETVGLSLGGLPA